VASDPPRRVWKLGGRVSKDGQHSCSFVRDLSESEVQELQAKFKEIDELAEQRGFSRVVESSERWGAILDVAEVELEIDGALSNRSQRAAWLELNAFSRLGQLLFEELTDAATDLADPREPHAGDFDCRLARLRRSGPQALLAEAFREQRVPADLRRNVSAAQCGRSPRLAPLSTVSESSASSCLSFQAKVTDSVSLDGQGCITDLSYSIRRNPLQTALPAELPRHGTQIPAWRAFGVFHVSKHETIAAC
jgi:hypothetical protein